jgi:hypothetical protein
MNESPLDTLVKAGHLKKEAPDKKEFGDMVESARKRLADSLNEKLFLDSRFDLAYNASYVLAQAAMRYRGYRPAGKRFIVFQALQHTMGLPPEIWRVLDKCHTLRNRAEYEGSFDVDEQLVKDLIRCTVVLEKAIGKLAAL